MDLTLSEKVMYSTVQVEMLDNKLSVFGHGSGFIMSFRVYRDEKAFIPTLVTNRHVLKCDYIKITFSRRGNDGLPDARHPIPITLNTKCQLTHPNPEIDISILPIGAAIGECENHGIARSIPISALLLSLMQLFGINLAQ